MLQALQSTDKAQQRAGQFLIYFKKLHLPLFYTTARNKPFPNIGSVQFKTLP